MSARPDLLPAATRERALREKHWPVQVAAKAMTQADADADIAAWRTIEQLLADGVAATPLPWSALIDTVQRAMDRQTERAWAGGTYSTTPEAEARFGAVADIRRTLERAAWRVGQCLGQPQTTVKLMRPDPVAHKPVTGDE